MCYTIGTKRASELLGISMPTIRGMIDHPQDVGYELGFKVQSSKKNPERRTYRVYAKVVADKLGITVKEVLEE